MSLSSGLSLSSIFARGIYWSALPSERYKCKHSVPCTCCMFILSYTFLCFLILSDTFLYLLILLYTFIYFLIRSSSPLERGQLSAMLLLVSRLGVSARGGLRVSVVHVTVLGSQHLVNHTSYTDAHCFEALVYLWLYLCMAQGVSRLKLCAQCFQYHVLPKRST